MHMIKLKSPNNVINMNAVLVDTFLGLIPNGIELLYEQERMMNPNAVFRECFGRFVKRCGRTLTLAEDRETNQTAIMADDRHPTMGFEVLTSCLFRDVTFARPLRSPNYRQRQFQQWRPHTQPHGTLHRRVQDVDHPRQRPQQDERLHLIRNCIIHLSVPASQHGYGMAATDDDASTPPLADAVSKFGTAHAATQESLRYNTAAMRGQLQMLCLVIGSGQPPRRWRLQRGRWRQRRRQPRQPPPVKRFENWNDCQTHGHGGDKDSSYG